MGKTQDQGLAALGDPLILARPCPRRDLSIPLSCWLPPGTLSPLAQSLPQGRSHTDFSWVPDSIPYY